mgnify:FL=1
MRPSRLYPVLAHAGGPDLLAISRARTPGDPGVEHAARLLADVPRETLAPVPWVTGNDLISMGLKPCPAMKDLLAGLLADQMDGVLSDRDAAQAEARSRINKL